MSIQSDWTRAIQEAGAKTLKDRPGMTAREALARVLWSSAIKGDLRAAALILKYDLGEDEAMDDSLKSDRAMEEALERAYGCED